MVATCRAVLFNSLMNPYKNIEIFQKCNSLRSQCYIVNEWDIHNNFGNIKKILETNPPRCMIVESTDAVHPYFEQYQNNIEYLSNFFKQHTDNLLIYYSVNYYTEFNGISNVRYYHFPEYHAYYYPIYQDVTVQDYQIDKKFLCLNKRVDVSRWALYKKFYTDNLIEQSLFSFLGEDRLFGTLEQVDMINAVESLYQQMALTHNEFLRLKTPDPLFLQINDDNLLAEYQSVKRSLSTVDPTWAGNNTFYQRTFCSVISETSPEANKPNFSEKIFRTICYGHPFILLGAQHSLAMLKELGFDTYDDIFDNSYDTEPVRDRRILKVFKTIDEISAQNLDSLDKLKKKLLPRRLANIKNYQNMYQTMLNRSQALVQELDQLTR